MIDKNQVVRMSITIASGGFILEYPEIVKVAKVASKEAKHCSGSCSGHTPPITLDTSDGEYDEYTGYHTMVFSSPRKLQNKIKDVLEAFKLTADE